MKIARSCHGVIPIRTVLILV